MALCAIAKPSIPPPLHSSPLPHYRPIALCGGRSGAVWLCGAPETLAFPETRGIFGVLGAFRGTLLKWRNLARGFLLPRYFLPFRSFAELGAFVVLGATEIALLLTYVYIFRSVVAKVRQMEYRAVGGSLSRRVKGTSLNNPTFLWLPRLYIPYLLKGDGFLQKSSPVFRCGSLGWRLLWGIGEEVSLAS
jgi:hypothetical protein